jgi:hypothetical protein
MWLAIVVTILHQAAPHFDQPRLKCGDECPAYDTVVNAVYRIQDPPPTPRYLGEFKTLKECRAAIDLDFEHAESRMEYLLTLCVPKEKP